MELSREINWIRVTDQKHKGREQEKKNGKCWETWEEKKAHAKWKDGLNEEKSNLDLNTWKL